MPQFQGSGFALTLPEECYDASAYTFALPENNGFAPNLSIRFETVPAGTDIKQYADHALASLSGQFEGFELIDKLSGKRGEWDGVMATVAWGEGAARMLQKLFYMLVCRKQCRVYILTTTDLLGNAKQSAPVFDQMLRSFAPNEIQFIWGSAD